MNGFKRIWVAAALLLISWQAGAQDPALSLPGNADVRIVVDISGSMKETDPQNLRRPAVRLLARTLPEGASATFNPEQVTPSAADGWLTALRLYGTMTFEQVVTPALELAEKGFPIPYSLHRALVGVTEELVHDEGEVVNWSTTEEIFAPAGEVLKTGEILVQTDLANTFWRLISQ